MQYLPTFEVYNSRTSKENYNEEDFNFGSVRNDDAGWLQ